MKTALDKETLRELYDAFGSKAERLGTRRLHSSVYASTAASKLARFSNAAPAPGTSRILC